VYYVVGIIVYSIYGVCTMWFV